ncbi:STM4014 family protein [Limnoglobus roseus]|uniref:ATP-grasp domain-containing protein n=1 Tax=Limnoglobus roseus TaxID=2598579 RepID=A0A5C1AH59_9BACT|nr:STM4014 family protein [Limnoglobus roseus]QEL17965.1 hypothetical protein PX52LOC_04979 [Limnoglobus roseus]
MTGRRLTLVANPGHKRVVAFQAALARRGWPPAVVVPWLDLASGRQPSDSGPVWKRIRGLTPPARPDFLRLESPGQDFAVEQALLARGADESDDDHPQADRISATAAGQLPFEKGRILHPRQWYRGFRAVLRELEGQLSSQVRCLNRPADVIDLFDKRRCQSMLSAAGVPIPSPLGSPQSFEELLATMRAAGRQRVFVKLACGSSGSGVVAFALGRDRMMATTTVELVRRDGRVLMFNSRRLRRYELPADVTDLFDTLCAEGVQVEEWLPKATFRGRGCDLRVLVIAGRDRHAVVRLSDTPITNLHLLNERADAADLRKELPAEKWEVAMSDCRRAAAVFGGCHHVGIDLAFTPGFRRHAILEANAFGDFLPGLLCDGLDTHEAELVALEDEVTSR